MPLRFKLPLFSRPSRRRTALAVLALAAVAMSSAPVAADAPSIRVGVQAAPPDEVYIGKDWGKPYGLTIDYTQFSSGGEMLKAFVSGRIDVANGGSARIVSLAAKQPELFWIIATHQFGGDRYGLLVPKDSPAKEIADLKGKKIGGVTGSGAFNTLRVYMEQQGLSESDFKIVNMKVQDVQSALQQGIIDAGIAWEPFPSIAETAGVARRLVSMKGVNESPVFLMVSRKFAKENPEAVVKYAAAVIDASNFMKKDSKAAGQLAAEAIRKGGVAVDPDALTLSFTRFEVGHQVTDDLIAELIPIAESMKEAGKIKRVPDFKALVKNDYHQQAMKIAVSRK